MRGNSAWIHRTIAEWEELNAARRHRPFVQGSSFPYLGRNYRLRFVTEANRPLMLRNGWFELDEWVLAEGGEPGARKIFRDFYTEKAVTLLEERVTLYARRVDVRPGPVAVRELPLGFLRAEREPQLSLEDHDGPRDSHRLRRRPRALPLEAQGPFPGFLA